jgi:hypothetical protein
MVLDLAGMEMAQVVQQVSVVAQALATVLALVVQLAEADQ